MKKTWIGVAVTLLALIAYLALWPRPAETSPATAPLRPAHIAAEGRVETMPGYDIDLGTSELNGKVAEIRVKTGDRVHSGQTVAVLENQDLQALVAQSEQDLQVAKARLAELESGARKEERLQADAQLRGALANQEEAHRQLQRNRELITKKTIPQASLDSAESAFKAAQATADEAQQRKNLLAAGPKPETIRLYRDQVRLAEAACEYNRKRLETTIIRSPIDGTVIERYLDAGEGVTPQTPILAIADLGKTWINAEVDETDVGRVTLGDKVNVTSDAYPGKVFAGTVSEIANYAGARGIRPDNPAVNLGLKIVKVKITLKEVTSLRLGMTVQVRIMTSPG
ncbi:HlyD family secretion protein [Thiothrix nivea]|uniref:Secretion protein HlyD family protein n=1 Tax=Thiothrix nivea (strain ATCC 35100 / DSM 5205 / JP2) TaxID=870187 RepID=A0A656HLY5_THINJ|nr:efflux RND transporter periplasmic adaptor subunit [Thiothrix nivea]EIJ36309.1 secretion protein HlyD family protein [Thiothrix nivea DSM 5205]